MILDSCCGSCTSVGSLAKFLYEMWRSRLQTPVSLILNALNRPSGANAPTLLHSLLGRTLSTPALTQSGIGAPDAERAGIHVLRSLFDSDPLLCVSLIRMRGFMFALLAEDYVLFEPYVRSPFLLRVSVNYYIASLCTVFSKLYIVVPVLVQCTYGYLTDPHYQL